MENDKQKLFQPSDFDKDVTNKKRSHLFRIIIGSSLIIIILVAIFLFNISLNNVETNSSLAENNNNLTERIIESTDNDSSSQLNNSDNNKELVEGLQTIVEDEPKAKVEEREKNDSEHSLSSSATNTKLPIGSIEEQAHKVIRGDYGNGLERKQKLGDEYTVIQNKVNEMYREGLVD